MYVDDHPNINTDTYDGYSFRKDRVQSLPYAKDFIPKMSEKAVGYTMKDSSSNLKSRIEEDIIMPEFYDDFAELSKVEMTQA